MVSRYRFTLHLTWLQWFANGTIQIRCTQVTIEIDRRSVALSTKKSLFWWQRPLCHFSPHHWQDVDILLPTYIFVNSQPESRISLLLKRLFLINCLYYNTEYINLKKYMYITQCQILKRQIHTNYTKSNYYYRKYIQIHICIDQNYSFKQFFKYWLSSVFVCTWLVIKKDIKYIIIF